MNALVTVATDGSAINNPHGPAGWAWFVAEDCWAAGGFTKASNQVAELFAVLAALRAIPRHHPILFRTDSQFTINVITKWMRGWKQRGWKKADGTTVANLNLIQDLDRALTGRKVTFQWVRGHSGDPMNEIADKLCSNASKSIKNKVTYPTGPGWTGYNPNPVIPGAPARPAVRKAPARLVGDRVTADDLAGYGTNARVVRVAANNPVSNQGSMDICPSCDGAINPLTLHCRCGSL